MIRAEGEIDYDGPRDAPVRNLVFRGLTFSGGDLRLKPGSPALKLKFEPIELRNIGIAPEYAGFGRVETALDE